MVMNTPNGPQVTPPNAFPSPMPQNIDDTSIRGASFDQLLANRGIRFTHKRAVPCPNMKSLDDNSHDPLCPFCDSSNILRYGDKEIVGVFQSDSLQKLFERQGIWEIGSAIVTLPTEYSDGTEADFNTFDQLVILDFEVRLWELKQYKSNMNGTTSLRYPISQSGVDFICSIKNGIKTTYTLGVDFDIVSGKISWINTPTVDSVTGLGPVFSIAYYALPVFNVLQHMRELRVTQEMQPDGSIISKRLPQEILVKRDFLVNPPDQA
jgi:hypothetical protein